MPKASEERLIERIRVKGREFDQNGHETSNEELCQMGGLFDLKDVKDRIPFEAKRLKYWYTHPTSAYYSCFVKLPVGENRSLVYVDLKAIMARATDRAS